MWQSGDAVFNLCHWGRSLVSLRFSSICNRIQLQSEKSKIISKFFFREKKNQSELEGRQDNQTLLHQKELINAKDSPSSVYSLQCFRSNSESYVISFNPIHQGRDTFHQSHQNIIIMWQSLFSESAIHFSNLPISK